MQNTYQEKSLDPIDKDFLFGKKLEGGIKLSTVSDFKPAGDQPEAIKQLVNGANKDQLSQVLLGVILKLLFSEHSTIFGVPPAKRTISGYDTQ